MEKNHKNTDCYFFYYSTCTKGDSCAYRHEASALGCETVCSYWQQGKCVDQHCNFRHMDIKKNRKVIPCYWEKFPTGCKKPHCPFLHRLGRTGVSNPIEPVKASSAPTKPVNQEWTNRQDAKFDGNSTESEQGRGSSEAGSFVVDPLIVNFEEESDNESMPSPTKNTRNRISSCKTYEEIRLEEIQAESAAFYSYGSSENYQTSSLSSGGGKVKKLTSARSQRLSSGVYKQEDDAEKASKDSGELDFEVLSLEEIRKRRRSNKVAESKKEEEIEVFLKDTFKRLDELKSKTSVEVSETATATTTTTTTVPPRKRNFGEVESVESEDKAKKARTQTVVRKTSPIKLRRHRIISISNEEDKAAEVRKEEEDRRAQERLAENKKDDADSSSSVRRQSIEVRICDSSTDDNQSSESIEEKDKKGKDIMDSFEDSLDKSFDMCDSGKILLTTDADDDILKDIDALLTDKPVS